MIDAEKVKKIFMDCLSKDEEVEPVKVEGIINTFRFHPERIKKNEKAIVEFLNELPEQFFPSKGDGWSFLNMCNTKDGEQWTGLHQRMEQLMCLGIAIGKIKYLMPREMWKALPGGMPYFVIKE